MSQLLIAILGVLITIFLVVGIHEFGHFIVARWVGVKVLRFSIGFGKILYKWTGKSGTEYAIALLPLGGYVKLLDEAEEPVSDAELPRAFNRQPFYKKFAIVAAGPLFNLIFAIVIYWAIFMIGFVSVIPLIGKVAPNSIAATAGIQPQQEIISINNTPTTSWMSIVVKLLSQAGEQVQLPISTKNLADQKINNYKMDLTHWHLDNLKPDPLGSLGITPYIPNVPPVIGKIKLANHNLEVGDKILAIENKPIHDWFDVADIIEKNPNTTLPFKIDRKGKIIQLLVSIHSQRDLFFTTHGYLGISADYHMPENLLRQNKYKPVAALEHAWRETMDFCQLNFLVIGKLFTGKISIGSLGGPITIFQSAGTALNNGILPFFSFLAFLSISIGLINVLPIPGLDGGMMLFQIIELIIRRPIPMRAQVLFYRLGLILLLLLMSQALLNDILRL